MKITEEEYSSEIAALFERHQSVAVSGFNSEAYKPGLEAMSNLDRAIGHPSGKLRCIHVAGTNGKGTTCSMIAAALASKGYRVGLYTSPHIEDFRERMKLVTPGGWSMIPKEEVMEFIITAPIERLSFFEVTTGMAFNWFAKEKVDWAVIEVGLGGRLDSTNIINPALSIITSIGLDHCAILGNTRKDIASEKAGIFKKGKPAIVWGRDEDTATVFESKAAEVGCPLIFADEYPELASLCPAEISCDPNLRTVLCALREIGISPSPDALVSYREMTGFEGRAQMMRPDVYCDIGHNPAALKLNLERFCGPGKPLTLVYGVMADKDYRTILKLIPQGTRLLLCEPRTPRALPLEDLETAVRELRPELGAQSFRSVEAAVEAALPDTAAGRTVLITGSTYVVSEASALLKGK